jgi:hypothetical protein
MSVDQKENLDSIISYLLIKRLVTPITRSKAFSLKLVNNAGRVIKQPKTEEERSALTVLDKLVFKLKRLLGSKLVSLNSFLYLATLSNDFYNKLIVKGTVNQRAEIIRIKRDIDKLAESYQMPIEDIINSLIVESIQHEEIKDEIN